MEEKLTTAIIQKIEQQNEKLMARMEEQSQSFKDLVERQEERIQQLTIDHRNTVQHIRAVENDVGSMKNIVGGIGGKLNVLETMLTQVRERQSHLGQQQDLMEQSLRESFGQQQGAWEHASRESAVVREQQHEDQEVNEETLRVNGNLVVRSEEIRPNPISSFEGSSQRLSPLKPATFDGKSDWDAYRTQFELLSQLNGWNEADKVAHLAISLRGSAAMLLSNRPPGGYSYTTLVAALESRFGSAHQTELNRMRLKTRIRQRGESLPELAESIEHLVRLAYPEAAVAMIQVLAKDHFIDSLVDEDIKLRIRQSKPSSLKDALRTALELESYQLASHQSTKSVRGTRIGEEVSIQAKVDRPTDAIQQLVEALDQFCVRKPAGQYKGKNNSRRAPGCWHCGQIGHRKFECPQINSLEAVTLPRGYGKPSVPTTKDVFMTGSIFSGGDSLVVSGHINSRPCELTVDTGSNISIVRPDILKGIHPSRIQVVNCQLRTVTGEQAPIHGKGQFDLRIGSVTVPQELWVADIQDQCILGLDFLRTHDCQVNLKDQALIIGREEVPLKRMSSESRPTCCKATLVQDVSLPPHAESIITVKLSQRKQEGHWGIVESNVQSKKMDGLLVARTLVNLQQDKIPLRVMNLSTQSRMVKKGTEIGICECIISILTSKSFPSSILASSQRAQATDTPSLPLHLQNLYASSISALGDVQDQQKVRQLLCEYQDIFSSGPQDLGCTNLIKHTINTGDAMPIRQPPRRLPFAKRKEAATAIQQMLEQHVIEPSASPWSSPVVLIRKKDGSIRFCVDYRKLNNVTHKDSYPLPRIDDTIEALSGAKWFSALDLKSGYWQVQLDEGAKEKTAFSTGSGLWQFRVMPFGLCNAPATFERLMEQVLMGLPLTVALVYLDDILIPGRDVSEHLKNLKEVFERLRKASLKLKPTKCNLFKSEVKFLGHVVSYKGISPDPAKVEAVTSWPQPSNAAELKSFLGLCSYYRRFVPGFANIAQPLHKCVSSSSKHSFNWTAAAEKAFLDLRARLASTPILAYPNPEAMFILDTDASQLGIGAVLSQISPKGQERVIAYFSRALTTSEQNYCTTRKELLALVKSIKHFHPYLYGKKFLLRTDHSSLCWLLNFRHPEGQVARWIETVQQYDFQVEHRSGSLHSNADALSRRPCMKDCCKYCDRLEMTEKIVSTKEAIKCSHCSKQRKTCAMTKIVNNSDIINWSNTTLKQAQLEDVEIRPILELRQQYSHKPAWEEVASLGHVAKTYWAQWQSLVIIEGVLYREWETKTGDATIMQLILPWKLRKQVLQQLHDAPTGGHLGITKTLARIKQRFYWVQCARDVQEYCQHCDICAKRRGPPRRAKAPLKIYNVGAPMERIAIDVMGPLPVTESGHKYIVVVADYFTKWTEAYPLPDQEAHTIAEVLVNRVIARFGVPLFLHSDQGRNFESKLIAECCTMLGIKKTRTTPYHPQSDGMVERFNRTLQMQLSKFVDQNQRDWDLHLPLLLMAYRSAVHKSTGCSPAMMMLGRELRLPVDLFIQRPEKEVLFFQGYAARIQERLLRVHNFARANMEISSKTMKNQHDLYSHDPPLTVGDPVWLHNPQRKKGLSPKLQSPWQGPFVVTKHINDLVYRIQQGPQAKPKVVHRNRLWKYSGTSPPKWNITPTGPPSRNQLSDSSNNQGNPPILQPGNRKSQRKRKAPERYGTWNHGIISADYDSD